MRVPLFSYMLESKEVPVMGTKSTLVEKLERLQAELTSLHCALLTAMGIEHKMLEERAAHVCREIETLTEKGS